MGSLCSSCCAERARCVGNGTRVQFAGNGCFQWSVVVVLRCYDVSCFVKRKFQRVCLFFGKIIDWFPFARVQLVACIDIGVRSLAVTMLFKFG